MQNIKLRMCVQLDYEVEIDPTDFETINDAYLEIERNFTKEDGVRDAAIMKGISIDMKDCRNDEFEYALDTACDLAKLTCLNTKQKELADTIVYNLEKIKNKLDKKYDAYLDNKLDNRLFKLLDSKKTSDLGFFLDEVHWRAEDATEQDWKNLREAWREFFNEYLSTQKIA